MKEEIKLSTEELLRIYRFMEKANNLFHQQLHYKDLETVKRFASENYPEIRELYYHLLWEKLPKNIQNEITEE